MPNIPVYGDYRVKLRDAPDVRQTLTTNADLFGGNQAEALKGWGNAFGKMGNTLGDFAEREKKKEEKEAAKSAAQVTADAGEVESGGNDLYGDEAGSDDGAFSGSEGSDMLYGGSGNDTLDGETSQPTSERQQQDTPTSFGELDRQTSSDSTPVEEQPAQGLAAMKTPTADTASQPVPRPATPTPEQQAALDAVFDRQEHTPQSLLEYREAQADLADGVRQWRKAVAGGEMTGEDARALLRSEVKGHTMAMQSMDAVRAIRGWEQRQGEYLKATEAPDGDRLSAATAKRTEQRHRDIADSGGDMNVFVPQANRLVRDLWEDGRAQHLSAKDIDAKVRSELTSLSATAVLSMAVRDPEQAQKTLSILYAKNFLGEETATPLRSYLDALKGVPTETEAVTGGEGQDVLIGGAGNDVLAGGSGTDDDVGPSPEKAAPPPPASRHGAPDWENLQRPADIPEKDWSGFKDALRADKALNDHQRSAFLTTYGHEGGSKLSEEGYFAGIDAKGLERLKGKFTELHDLSGDVTALSHKDLVRLYNSYEKDVMKFTNTKETIEFFKDPKLSQQIYDVRFQHSPDTAYRIIQNGLNDAISKIPEDVRKSNGINQVALEGDVGKETRGQIRKLVDLGYAADLRAAIAGRRDKHYPLGPTGNNKRRIDATR